MKNFTLKTLFLSVLLCVSNWAGADNYVKITSTSDLESGKYLIVYEASNVAFNGGLTTLDATSNTIEVTISNKTIAASDETNAAAFTYDATDNSLKSASGYYIGQTKSANGLVQNESTKYSNVITFDESGNANITVTVSGSNVYLRYNKTSGQARFRYYKTGQEAIQLYKLVTSGGGEEPEPTAALSSIALSGTYPTTFTEGDAFSSEGMTVTATYEDKTTKDVTANATFSGYDMSTTGEQTVTVSYTENEVTKTATYSITVNENVIPAHNVTWSTNGTTNTDSYKEGEDIEFPENPSNIGGNVFVGWAEESINGTTNSDPTFVTSAKMGEANITYYAVFATLVSEATAVDDELTNSTTGVSNNSYTEWSGKTGTSGAVYAGQSAGSFSSIQLRATSPSGIITTTSTEKARKIAVEWNSNTASGRTLDVYGKNTAYSQAADLYSNNTQGTKLGSIVYGTSTELEITGDYEFIGLRSANGAMYLDQVTITWGDPATYSDYCTTIDNRETAGLSFTEAIVTKEITANYAGQELTNPNNLTPITWTSTDEEVATVENGVLTFKVVGTTTITASFAGNSTYKAGDASYTLTITKINPTLEFGDYTATIDLGDEFTEPELTYNGDGEITYSSSDKKIATVDKNTGAVTILAAGTVTITATAAEGANYTEAEASYTLTINKTIVDGEFDFTWGEDYESGLQTTSDGNHYEENAATWIAGNVTMVTNGKYRWWNSDKTLRTYSDGDNSATITISAPVNNVITKVVFNGGSAFSADKGELKSTTWTGGTQTVTFTATGTSNLKSITVTYEPIYTRNVTAGNFGTICLPYAVKEFEGATFYTISGKKANVVVLEEVNELEAGVGYIFEATAATISLTPNGEKVTEPVTTGAIIGTFEDATEVADDMYIVSNNTLRKTSGGFGRLNAFRAYVDLSEVNDVQEAKGRVLYFEGDATGIETVEAGAEAGEAVYYNLNGQRVTNPEKGIYIVNGKKVLVK